MVNVRGLLLEFSGDSFELLRYIVDFGAEVLLYVSGFLDFPLSGQNLRTDNSFTNSTFPIETVSMMDKI